MLNKLFATVEQIIITLLEENRYSFQVARSIELLSLEMNLSSQQLDYSINSLRLIDNYINNLISKSELNLEIYLSITIYLSQVLILSCDGFWSIEYKKCLLPGREDFYECDEDTWMYSLVIEIYCDGFVLYPQYVIMDSMNGEKSGLEQEVISTVDIIKNYQIDTKKLTNRYDFSGLEILINKGLDFYSEIIPLSVSRLSDILNIPRKKLNKSVSSLKLVSECIRTNGEIFLCDRDFFDEEAFLILSIYIGEVIIKSINGEWKISSEKIHLGEILKYRWTMKIFNSKAKELDRFMFDMVNSLREYSYKQFNAKSLVEGYIRTDREQDDTIWRDTTIYPKTRIWKKVLEHRS